MTTLRTGAKKCVLCGQISTLPYLTSTNAFGSCDLDFRPPEMQRSTMPYWVEECSYCGYVAEDISAPVPFPKYVVQLITSESYANCDGIEFKSDLAKAFYRQYFLAMEKGDKQDAMTAIHHAAWVCDDDPDEEENAKKCRELALEIWPVYSARYMDNEDEDEEREDLIRADLLRRAGLFDDVISDYTGKHYTADKVHDSIIQYQVELATKHDAACHTVEEAISYYPVPKIIYYSVAVGDRTGKTFYYLGNEEGYGTDYEVGERVLVPFGEHTRIGTIMRVEEYDEDDVPFPMEQTREIIGRYDPTIDHSAPGYVPATTQEYSGIIGLLKLRKIIPEVHNASEEGYEWLGPKELCLFVPNQYGDEPLKIHLGDNYTLMYRGWEKVYEYPYNKDGPGYGLAEAQREIARKNYSKLCDELLDFIDTRLCVVLGYIGDKLIGGVIMNSTTAHRSTEATLLSKITSDPEIIQEARKVGAKFVLASWMAMLDSTKEMRAQKYRSNEYEN